MAKNAISDYSSTAASNTDVGGVDIQGSAAASNMDDSVRELMSHLADAAFGASMSLTSTDAGATIGPTLDIYRNSASPLAADVIGGITFSGEDDGGTKTEYARIEAQINDPTDTGEDGTLNFAIMKAGTSASILTLNPNTLTITPSSTLALINTNDDANGFILQGGNTASQGAQIFVYGDAHATQASDIRFVTDNVLRYIYDSSAAAHLFTGTVSNGTFSATGATAGSDTSPGVLNSSTTATSATAHVGFYNPNGGIGSITTSGSATAYNTSSDQRLKKNFRAAPAAGPRIDRIKIHEFDWKDGSVGIGPKAQELFEVFPEAVTPGEGEPGETGFRPWGWDASKLVPFLVLEIQSLRQRVAAIENGGGREPA